MKTEKKSPKLGLTEVINEARDSVLYHGDQPVAVIVDKTLICNKRLTEASVKALADKYQTRVERVRRTASIEQDVNDVYSLIEAVEDNEGEEEELMDLPAPDEYGAEAPGSEAERRQAWQGARATQVGNKSMYIVVNDRGDSICYSYQTPIAFVQDGVLYYPTRENGRYRGQHHSFSITSTKHFSVFQQTVQYSSQQGIPYSEFATKVDGIVRGQYFPVGSRGRHSVSGTGILRVPQIRRESTEGEAQYIVSVLSDGVTPRTIKQKFSRDALVDYAEENGFTTYFDVESDVDSLCFVHKDDEDARICVKKVGEASFDDAEIKELVYDITGERIEKTPLETAIDNRKGGVRDFDEKKMKTKESFLHPGDYTTEFFELNTSSGGYGGPSEEFIPVESGNHFTSIPQLVNYVAKCLPEGVDTTEVSEGQLYIHGHNAYIVVHKGEERQTFGDMTERDGQQIKAAVNSRVRPEAPVESDPLAWQGHSAMAENQKREKSVKTIIKENIPSGAGMADKVIVVPHGGNPEWTLMLLKDFDFAMRLFDTVEGQKWFPAEDTTRETMFDAYKPLLAFVKDSKPVYVYSLTKEGDALDAQDEFVPLATVMAAIGVEASAAETIISKAKELAGAAEQKPADLPEARAKKPTLPARLYHAARQNLDLILDLDESVSDDTGAVAAVKKLGIKLVRAMKARDKSESLLMVEKLDLQIRGYMALRETTGVHNYLVMERFHIFQKRTHQLFDEEKREWVDFINAKR